MGKMGHAFAERLLGGGHDVSVWNRTPHKADDLIARGAREAATPARAATGADATLTSLANDDVVLGTVTGPEGVAAGLGDGVLIDASTVSPETTAQLYDAVAGSFIASPVLGPPSRVVSGEAMYLVGGPRKLYDCLQPAYATLAEHGECRYLGEDVGVPSTLKVLANYLLHAGLNALAEAIATAEAVGLPDDLIRDFFRDRRLVAPVLGNRLEAIIDGNHDGWSSTTLGAKDVRLAERLARRQGVRLPVAETVRQRYEEAAAGGWANADITAVVELLRKRP